MVWWESFFSWLHQRCPCICTPCRVWSKHVTERTSRRVVYVLLAIAMIIFIGFSLARLVRSLQSPVRKYSTRGVSTVDAPGVVICPDNGGGQTINTFNYTCGMVRAGQTNPNDTNSNENFEPCPFELKRFRFNAVISSVNECLVIPEQAGRGFRDVRDVMQLTFVLAQNLSTANYYDSLFFGIYGKDVALEDAVIFLGIGSGINVIAVQQEEFTDLTGNVRKQPVIVTSSAVPALPNTSYTNSSINTVYTPGRFYLYPQQLAIATSFESVLYQPQDFVSAVGGLFTILALIGVTLNGPGPYEPHGWLHRCCYRHLITQRKRDSTGDVNDELAFMRAQQMGMQLSAEELASAERSVRPSSHNSSG